METCLEIKFKTGFGCFGAYQNDKPLEKTIRRFAKKMKVMIIFSTDQRGNGIMRIYGTNKRIKILTNIKSGYIKQLTKKMIKTAYASKRNEKDIEWLKETLNIKEYEKLTNPCQMGEPIYVPLEESI